LPAEIADLKKIFSHKSPASNIASLIPPKYSHQQRGTMTKILVLAMILTTKIALASSSTLQYVDAQTAQSEISRALSGFSSAGTSEARIDHKNVLVPCAITLNQENGTSEVQMRIGQNVKSFFFPSRDISILITKESLSFDESPSWSLLNYSWSYGDSNFQRLSLSNFGQNMVIVIDAAKCAVQLLKP
jgi:hypothetical protein